MSMLSVKRFLGHPVDSYIRGVDRKILVLIRHSLLYI
jgi:hypothetical protein